MAIIDCITFNGEFDLFEIRYNILKDAVDQFIVCEAPTTFSGKPKPLYFEQIRDKYPRVKYFVIDENYSAEEIALAESSPNTHGAAHWQHEFLQKESILKSLTHLTDADIVFIGDCDELWNPEHEWGGDVQKIKLFVYCYYLNQRSNEEFWGTIVGRYEDIKHEVLNHLRSDGLKPPYDDGDLGGWHFTSLKDGLKRKLEDSYTAESYATLQVMAQLDQNIQANKDFLGRDFTYTIDESDWPQYLKDNRDKYKHLLKPNVV